MSSVSDRKQILAQFSREELLSAITKQDEQLKKALGQQFVEYIPFEKYLRCPEVKPESLGINSDSKYLTPVQPDNLGIIAR